MTTVFRAVRSLWTDARYDAEPLYAALRGMCGAASLRRWPTATPDLVHVAVTATDVGGELRLFRSYWHPRPAGAGLAPDGRIGDDIKAPLAWQA